MIDFHLHLGNVFREMYPHRAPLTAEQLLDRMDREGIEIGVLLPLESPEIASGYFLTEQAIEARDKYPERFIAFVGLDPRMPNVDKQIDVFVTSYGCRGFGELLNGLSFKHPLNRKIYAKCDQYGLPLVFDMCAGCLSDEYGLPGLEGCLRDFPNMQFVGHGPHFWSAICGEDDRIADYPTGPVATGGAIDRLMGKYPNLYLDLSARSGYNAMTRDPIFTLTFIHRHWQRMLFASDYFFPGQDIPQVRWLQELAIKDSIRDAIAYGNARKLLGLNGKG